MDRRTGKKYLRYRIEEALDFTRLVEEQEIAVEKLEAAFKVMGEDHEKICVLYNKRWKESTDTPELRFESKLQRLNGLFASSSGNKIISKQKRRGKRVERSYILVCNHVKYLRYFL